MSKWTKKASIRGLMLTRKAGQHITINHGEVKIEIVEVRGKEVRIAIEAPRDVIVLRGEQIPYTEKGTE